MCVPRKTYTMSYIYQSAAQEIFDLLRAPSPRAPPATISMSFIEISGEKSFDLLHRFSPLDLLRGKDDASFQPFPVCEPRVDSPQDLRDLISYGCNCRSTAATGVHAASSRSHAVLKIYIRREGQPEGSLTLVDLAGGSRGVCVWVNVGMWWRVSDLSLLYAGSEHRIDSMHHSAPRRKESALINKSLLALKDCIRSRAQGNDLDHFYRKVSTGGVWVDGCEHAWRNASAWDESHDTTYDIQSKLTLALKSSFVKPEARTAVIVTVSPASKDTVSHPQVHTAYTLSTGIGPYGSVCDVVGVV